ncbi:MAG: hypothetical protein GY822_02905 [Deltaproteobacteria bacterium]|nr:hypothetical protein [Deltaproteobacteria bacterium]
MQQIPVFSRQLPGVVASILFGLLLFQAGCSTAMVHSYDVVDNTLGPWTYNSGSRTRPGPPVEYKLKANVGGGQPISEQAPAFLESENEVPSSGTFEEVEDDAKTDRELEGATLPQKELRPAESVVGDPGPSSLDSRVEAERPFDVPQNLQLPTTSDVDGAPPNDAKAVGPPLGVGEIRLQCSLLGCAEKDRVLHAQKSFHVPFYVLAAFPVGVFSTIASAVMLITWTREQAEPKADPWLDASYLAATLFILGDQVLAAIHAFSHDDVKGFEEESVLGSWQPVSTSCRGGELVGGGFVIPIHDDGSLDSWDEADVVKAWIFGRGPRLIRLQGKEEALVVDDAQRCLWARQRGYRAPDFCR